MEKKDRITEHSQKKEIRINTREKLSCAGQREAELINTQPLEDELTKLRKNVAVNEPKRRVSSYRTQSK